LFRARSGASATFANSRSAPHGQLVTDYDDVRILRISRSE
jgi:hypothetical protein